MTEQSGSEPLSGVLIHLLFCFQEAEKGAQDYAWI